MAVFSYKALDDSGKAISGSVSAASREAAFDRLAVQGLYVTDVAESGAEEGGGVLTGFGRVVSPAELTMTIRRLATLIGADIPLVRSLENISTQIAKPAFREVMVKVKDDVQQGQSFSRALSRHPRAFPKLVCSMVRVGETGGILGSVLEQLADFMEREREVGSEVKAAMAYPCVILIVAAGVVVFLMSTAVPKLAQMFEGMGTDLPLPTQILLSISDVTTRYGLYLAAGSSAALVAFYLFVRSPQGRTLFDRYKLRLPILGSLLQKTSIARFARSLGALARGGVPMMEALDVVKEIMNNAVLTEAVQRMQERLRKGDTMAHGLDNEEVFPDMVVSMISAGEESGKLDDMLFRVADIYEMETRDATRMALSLLAPMMILGVAVMVGFIAFAMLLPIFRMGQGI